MASAELSADRWGQVTASWVHERGSGRAKLHRQAGPGVRGAGGWRPRSLTRGPGVGEALRCAVAAARWGQLVVVGGACRCAGWQAGPAGQAEERRARGAEESGLCRRGEELAAPRRWACAGKGRRWKRLGKGPGRLGLLG